MDRCSAFHSFPQIAHYFICINFSGEIVPQAQEAQVDLLMGQQRPAARPGPSLGPAHVSVIVSGSVLRGSSGKSRLRRDTGMCCFQEDRIWRGSVAAPQTLPLPDLSVHLSRHVVTKGPMWVGDRGQTDPCSHLGSGIYLLPVSQSICTSLLDKGPTY